MERGGPVPPQRHPLGVRTVALVADRPTETGVGTVGDHHVTGRHLAAADPLPLSAEAGAAERIAFHYRLDRLRLSPQRGASLGRVRGQHGVEVLPGDYVAVTRHALDLGPRHGDGPSEPMRAQALVAVPRRQVGAEAHVLKLAY